MRIALAQLTSGPDPGENLLLAERSTMRAAEAGAQLVVFPEAMMRSFGNSLRDVAEPVDGPWATRMTEIGRAHGICLVAGMFTPAEGGRVRNTLLVTGPDGIKATYDKIHLFDAFGFHESDAVVAGDELVVVDVAGVSIGLATCYDIRFPGMFTGLAHLGAQVVVVVASWGAGPGKVEQWELLTRARALDSTTFIAACGQAAPTVQMDAVAPTGVGHSVVVSPLGTTLGCLGTAPGLLIVDVDPAEVADARQSVPVLTNARL